jgi:hypothetical protein
LPIRARARERAAMLDERVWIVLVAGILLGWLFARWMRGFRSRSRNRIAGRGEVSAESILARYGFRVEERQATAAWSMMVDGVEVPIEVRVDLLVSRRGKRYVAEVKTGERAPDPCHPPTRRQLLEYAMVFDAREILLVDVPAGEVRRISFAPGPKSGAPTAL